MKNGDRIFPFTQSNAHDSSWFLRWFNTYQEMLTKKHGWYSLGSKDKTFSYYEVDAEINSEDTAIIKFYSMVDAVKGGRGELFLEKKAKGLKDDPDFQKIIRRTMTSYVVDNQIQLEIDSKIKSMLGKVAGQHLTRFGVQMNEDQAKDAERILRSFIERFAAF